MVGIFLRFFLFLFFVSKIDEQTNQKKKQKIKNIVSKNMLWGTVPTFVAVFSLSVFDNNFTDIELSNCNVPVSLLASFTTFNIIEIASSFGVQSNQPLLSYLFMS